MKIFPPPAVVSTKLTIVLKAIATLKSHSHTHIFKIASIQLCNVRQLLVTQHAFGTSMIVNVSKPSIREVLEEERGIQPDSSTYAGMLQGCIDRKTVVGGKLVHAHMIKTGFEIDPFLGNTLVNMYAKCGTVGIARQVFEKMPELNAVSWNAMIAGYAQNEHGEEAWKLYCQMQRAGMELNQFTFASVLKACASIVALEEGKQVHVHIIKTGFHLDVFVGSALVDMYAKCRSLDDACHVFDKMPERNVVSWNAMIAGNAQNGNNEDALKLFCQMQQAGMIPSQFTFASVLSACASHEALEQGEGVHVVIIKVGLDLDVVVGSALVDMYAKCGIIEDARTVFDGMPKRNVVSWTAMIAGYAQHEFIKDALQLFEQMQQANTSLNQFTFTSVLSICAGREFLEIGKQVHAKIVKAGFQLDISVGNALVNMYAKCESTKEACRVFNKMLKHDVVSWSAMIAGYAQNMYSEKAIELFCQMQHRGMKPEKSIFASILSAYARLADIEQGKHIHAHTIKTGFESDVLVGSAICTMYSKCGSIEDSQTMFDKMPKRDIVSWTSMIAGYAQYGYGEVALRIFEQMQSAGMNPDKFTLASVLGACSRPEALEQGKEVHAHIVKTGFDLDILVGSALVTMYSKCVSIESARGVFKNMPKHDLVSWSAMITGYTYNGYGEEALKHFYQMQVSGIVLDTFTFANVLAACADLAALEQGKRIHANAAKIGFESDVSVGSALVTMYSRCGSIEHARKMFDGMCTRDVVAWTAMIAGCAQHGCGEEALQLFEQMQQAGMKPDHVSFVGVLSACSHVGLVNEGRWYFDSMSRDYGIVPRVEHYACMVDLLGRAGCLGEAEAFINEIPFEPGALVWGTLLGACRVHGNMELGKQAAERLLELDPQNSATYVLLSNIYAEAGRWEDVAKVRTMMKDKGVKKDPGCSWIEVKNRVHTFIIEDRSHPQVEQIYAKLEELIGQIEEAGFVPKTNFVLHDTQQQKQHPVCFHSEMLAIAFGLINTLPGTPIRVIKNLRVCLNCHTATKFISKTVGREIIVRDASRFHHFRDWLCSCGDFW
eukprot:Gb_03579 [translate_table: standard]